MKKVLTFGFAILAVIAMLFSGIAAAQTTGTTTSTQAAGSTPSTQTTGGSTVSDPVTKSTASITTTGSTPSTQTTGGSTVSDPVTKSTASITTTGSTTPAQVAGTTTLAVTGVKPAGKESVQLSNLGDTTVSLGDFTLSVDSGDKFSLPSTTLAPGDDVVVYFSSGTSTDDSSYYLNNRDDVLRDVSGTVTINNLDGDKISSLSYDNIYSASAPGSKVNTASSSVPTTNTRSS